jgi:NAD(P)-dependent dehydrogenase (short-subunit alcohol dehydrogenase family)
MPAIEASELLRPGLLRGVSVLLAAAGAPAVEAGSLGASVGGALAGLGAHVSRCWSVSDASEIADGAVIDDQAAEHAARQALMRAGRIDVLVLDCASMFAYGLACGDAAGGGAPRGALRTCLDATWNVTRAVANVALLPAGGGGRIVYLAPAPDAGVHADAARAGLENLCRTLSIEWARHGLTAVTVAPGVGTAAGEVAALAAFLASPAGAYFSGCLLDLRGAAGR